MRTFDVDVRGQSLKMTEDGSGPVILFLHGAGGYNWNPMLKVLSATHRVLAPEHPGFGHSPTPDWMMSVGDLAFFYLDALDVMGLDRVHLVGHSLGGWTAAEIAIRNTTRLSTVTLMAPAGCRSDEVPFGDIFLWDAETYARNQFYDQRLAAERIQHLPQQDLDATLQNKATVARLAWTPRLYNPQLKYWLHRIDKPCQLIWGRQDRIVPFECRHAFVERIKGVKIVDLDESGHSLHTERPSECAETIVSFCAEHS